jgi:hypothetical protein
MRFFRISVFRKDQSAVLFPWFLVLGGWMFCLADLYQFISHLFFPAPIDTLLHAAKIASVLFRIHPFSDPYYPTNRFNGLHQSRIGKMNATYSFRY